MSTRAPVEPDQFDPGGEIPDAYDLFCEKCGYSLAGLTGERCPECGERFDAKDLPFARVPWLHRRRLGMWKAYWRTVVMVAFGPRRFAAELCRPVRVSAADARRFRSTTIWLATISVGLAMIGGAGTAIGLQIGRGFVIGPWFNPVIALVFGLLGLIAAVILFHALLSLMTDMPLFIWKTLPSMKPTELAPVHHYASAPLAFIPVAAPIVGLGAYLAALGFPITTLFLLAVAAAAVLSAWLWIVALALIRSASRAGPRRVLALALYLPFHWMLVGFAVLLGLGVILFFGSILHARAQEWLRW